MYQGDIAPSSILDIKFTSRSASTGVPATLSGTPAISVYKDNSTTQTTTGVTLTVDFDSVTGLNNVRIDTSADGTFYSAGSNFQLVITTGAVGGNSVVGYVVGAFSINNRTALRPTTAGRTLDVSTGGEAGIDWANVGTPSSTVSLSGTTVATVTTATATTTVNGLGSGVVTAASIAASALNGKGDWNIGKTGYALSAAGVQAIWDALTSALSIPGSIGKYIVDNLASISSSTGTITTGVATVNSTTVAIKTKTDLLPSSPSAMTVKRATAFGPVTLIMRDSSGNALTGLVVTATRSIDGGAFAACTNAVAELSNGAYTHTWSVADLTGAAVTFRYTAGGARDLFWEVFPESVS